MLYFMLVIVSDKFSMSHRGVGMEWFDKNAAAIIAASAALTASLIAGSFALLGAWLNHKFSDKRFKEQLASESAKDNKRLYLEKGEELHSLLTTWGNTVFTNFIADQSFFIGRLSQGQRDEVLKDKFDPEVFTRINTLMSIYFTELSPEFERIRHIAVEVGQYANAVAAGIMTADQAIIMHRKLSDDFEPLLLSLKKNLQSDLLKQLKK